MKSIHLALVAAFPAALCLAGSAGAGSAAQTPAAAGSPPGQTQPQAQTRQVRPREPEAQPRASTMPTSSPASPGMQTDNPANPSGRFSTLAGSKGYVTRNGAASDAWLMRHFPACDANHDGRITRDEYDACHQQNPPRQ